MARKYSVNSGLTSLAASTTKVAAAIATGAGFDCIPIAFTVSFDSTATGAGAIPVRVELVRTTAAPSGGATFTPVKWNPARVAAQTTARINDTTDGTGPTILRSWLVSPTAGIDYQFPLGREFELNNSDFFEVRLISQAGMTTCNYEVTLDIEE